MPAEITQAVAAKYVALARKLEIPSTDQAGIRSVLCRQDGFEPVQAEQQDRRDWSLRYGAQLIGQFLKRSEIEIVDCEQMGRGMPTTRSRAAPAGVPDASVITGAGAAPSPRRPPRKPPLDRRYP